MIYKEELLNEFFNPQNVGVIKGANGVGKLVNEENGEIMKIYISVEEGKIIDCKFQTFGSAVSIACSSVATKLLIGKTLEEAEKITAKEIVNELGNEIPEGKEYSFNMVQKTIKRAIKNYYKKLKGGKNVAEDEDEGENEE